MARTIKKLSGGANPKLISREQENRLRRGPLKRAEQLANITRRQNNARTRRTQKKELRQAGVNEYKASIRDLGIGEKTTRLGAYKEYCENLQRSYDTKHGEVGAATEMIASIKSKLEGITVDVLKNLKKTPEVDERKKKLDEAINMQTQWTRQRSDNDKVITSKISEITRQIENLKVLSGSDEGGAPARNNTSGPAGRKVKKTKRARNLQRQFNNAKRR